jgi:regulator of nucleoside diphosphate kinase
MLTGLNDTMFSRPPVYVRGSDIPELWCIAAEARKTASQTDLFLQEFDRLRLASETTESDFVRLDSSVVYKDLRTKRQRRVRVVRPGSEMPEENAVSLLSPIGAALVGLKEGAIFRWADPDGRFQAIKVLEIAQPEISRHNLGAG